MTETIVQCFEIHSFKVLMINQTQERLATLNDKV